MMLTASAQSFNNPVDANGNVIVKYDLEKGAFAAANDFEVDETFVFALDITGCTELLDWVNGSAKPGITRSVGFADYTTNIVPEGETTPPSLDGRLWKIKGNIYGMIINWQQFATTRNMDGWMGPSADWSSYKSTTVGETTEFNGDYFGFGYTDDNPGAEWWNAPQQGFVPFATLPYTGTRTSKEFFKDEVDEQFPNELFAGSFGDWGGYAAPTPEIWNMVKGSAGIEGVTVSNAQEATVEFYNIQGQRLNAEPQSGLYIRKATMTDGSVKAAKFVK